MSNVVIVFGASGVVGKGAIEQFATAKGDWKVYGVSRRHPTVLRKEHLEKYTHLKIDLFDPKDCNQQLSQLTDITHVVYAALNEEPGSLVESWRSKENADINLSMMRNCIDPLLEHCKKIKEITWLQGGKHYGVHLKSHSIPAVLIILICLI
jgi:nucleoside-diphosphate-sugar epimerase